MQKLFSYCIPLFLAVIFIGCMDDPIIGPEVKPRLIQRPPAAYLQSLTGTTSLLARWNPSPSDTQANFKGYYVELFRSAFDSIVLDRDTNILPMIASTHTGRGDTSFLFTGLMPLQRYSVYVWGERVPNPTNPDSLILSQDYATASLDFDPDPVLAPDTLQASSAGPLLVNLRWSPSPSATQKGFTGYVIRYRDSVNSKAKIYSYVRPSTIFQDQFTLTLESSSSQITRFLFWIKALRNDSTESADSTFVAWSGAYRVPISGVASRIAVGKKIFIGQTNTVYDIVESDNAEAQIGVDTLVGGGVRLTALAGAKFATTIDEGDLNNTFYTYPLDDAAYTETAINLPISTASSGVIIYVRFAEGSRARLFIQKDGFSKNLLGVDAKIGVSASFQPAGPFDIHYY